MLYTKSIYLPPSLEDGIRISVMSRHTLDDGVTPDPLITSKSWQIWYKELAPPAKLVGAYYRGEISIEDYKKVYLAHLFKPETLVHVNVLTNIALSTDVTILCKELDARECHRSTLADACRIQRPYLRVEHR